MKLECHASKGLAQCNFHAIPKRNQEKQTIAFPMPFERTFLQNIPIRV